MRKIITTCVGAAALFMTMAFAPPLVQAMTIAAPAGVSTATKAAKLAQDVVYVCRGLLWRRCWWVPPVVVAPAAPAVVARPCPPGYHLGPAGRACRPN
jgi:hypothetical protein